MTHTYPPEATIEVPVNLGRTTTISVRDEDALVAARRLHECGLRPVVLNFASARNPGGGWNVKGVRGQEEELCRRTDLAAHLGAPSAERFYADHAKVDAMNSSWVLYSDGVVVKDAEPWTCAFVSCAAPNAKELFRSGRPAEELRELEAEIAAVFETRAERILAVAASQGHPSVVLGAWGCGNFGNDPRVVAGAFTRALRGPFLDVFSEVAFAVPGRSLRVAFESAVRGEA